MLSKYEGVNSHELNVTGLVESRVRKPSLKEIIVLGLYLGFGSCGNTPERIRMRVSYHRLE